MYCRASAYDHSCSSTCGRRISPLKGHLMLSMQTFLCIRFAVFHISTTFISEHLAAQLLIFIMQEIPAPILVETHTQPNLVLKLLLQLSALLLQAFKIQSSSAAPAFIKEKTGIFQEVTVVEVELLLQRLCQSRPGVPKLFSP